MVNDEPAGMLVPEANPEMSPFVRDVIRQDDVPGLEFSSWIGFILEVLTAMGSTPKERIPIAEASTLRSGVRNAGRPPKDTAMAMTNKTLSFMRETVMTYRHCATTERYRRGRIVSVELRLN